MNDEKLKINDWCISLLFNSEHRLFLQVLSVPAKIIDISEQVMKLRLLSGEIVECTENESLVIKTNTYDVISTAGHMLFVAQKELERTEEDLYKAQLDIRYDVQGALNQQEFIELEHDTQTVLDEIKRLKRVFKELGILKNFTQISE